MPSLSDQMRNLMEGTFDLVAGMNVTYVDENGTFYENLPGIWYDEPTRFRRDKLTISDDGLIEGNTNRLVLKQSSLAARNLNLNVAGHFIINNERWDFAANEPAMQKNLTPFAGVTNMFVLMYLRRAEEINNTDTTGDFGVVGWEENDGN